MPEGAGRHRNLLARIKDESGWRGNVPEEEGYEGGRNKSQIRRVNSRVLGCTIIRAEEACLLTLTCVEASGHSQHHNRVSENSTPDMKSFLKQYSIITAGGLLTILAKFGATDAVYVSAMIHSHCDSLRSTMFIKLYIVCRP